MNILLMRPEFSESHVSPHLGLGYLSASLKNAGHKVKILDGLREKIEYDPKDPGGTATSPFSVVWIIAIASIIFLITLGTGIVTFIYRKNPIIGGLAVANTARSFFRR